jgi:hypothetical protein
LSTAPATSAIVSDVPSDEQGVAAAVNDAMREVGAAIGIALSGSILAGRYAAGIVDVLPGVPEAGRQAVESSFAGAREFGAAAGPAGQAVIDAAAGIFADGISSALFALGMVAAGAAVLLLFVAPGRGYVALGDADTDTDTGTSGDPDPGADPAPVGAAGGTSGYPVAGSQEVRTRPAR